MWAGERSGQGFLLPSGISGGIRPRARDLPPVLFWSYPCRHFCLPSPLHCPDCCPLPTREVPEPSGGTGSTLNPYGVGRTPDSSMGRASSSAAALALYRLHKAFLLVSGSHPQHSEGNYQWLWLASIGNGPAAEPIPICSSRCGDAASSVPGIQSMGLYVPTVGEEFQPQYLSLESLAALTTH